VDGDGRLSDCDRSIEVVVAQLQLGVGRKGNQETLLHRQWGTTKCRKGSLLVLGFAHRLKGRIMTSQASRAGYVGCVSWFCAVLKKLKLDTQSAKETEALFGRK
jgi:hypothetical protein